jgi:hypothetical protein
MLPAGPRQYVCRICTEGELTAEAAETAVQRKARRRAGLKLGGERHQFVEQAAIIDQIGGAPHLLRDLGQPPLDAVDGGREPLR